MSDFRLLNAIVNSLPAEGTPMTEKRHQKYVNAIAATLNLMYPTAVEEEAAHAPAVPAPAKEEEG